MAGPHRPAVLLLHDDERVTESWVAALRDCEVRTAPPLHPNFEGWHPEVVICHFDDRLAERVRAHSPAARFIHCESILPAAVLEAIWQGHEVAWAETPSALQSKVRELARPDRA